MPVQDYGLIPFGLGADRTMNNIANLKLEEQRTNAFSERNALLDREMQAEQALQARMEEVRGKWGELQAVKRGPPEVQARWLAMQQSTPNFAQTPYAGLPPEQALPMMEEHLASVLGIEIKREKRDIREIGSALVEVPLEGAPQELYRAPQEPQQYAPAGYREVTVIENGKPMVYMVNERNPRQRVLVGEGQAKGAEAAPGAGLNERQQGGVKMQRSALIMYAANLTGVPRAEVERILATEGPTGVERLMIEKGKRSVQGKKARWLQSMPLGKTYVEAENADLIAPGKAGGAGIALLQNPTGPITRPDFEAGEAQFPTAIYPLHVQAAMVRQGLEDSARMSRGAAAETDDPLAPYEGKVIKQGNRRFQVMRGRDGKLFAQEVK